MYSNPNIAIDGPAGAGKSTVARMVANKLGLLYVDTGAMYRAMTLAALHEGVDPEDLDALGTLSAETIITLARDHNGSMKVLLNDQDVTQEIRTPEVTRNVSLVARAAPVRQRLVLLQQEMAAGGGVVMEGRDIGTVVMPDAQVKVFLTACTSERASRRRKELAIKGYLVDQHSMEEEINERDRIDSSREIGPLTPAPDAVVIDSSTMSVEQVVAEILRQVSAGR